MTYGRSNNFASALAHLNSIYWHFQSFLFLANFKIPEIFACQCGEAYKIDNAYGLKHTQNASLFFYRKLSINSFLKPYSFLVAALEENRFALFRHCLGTFGEPKFLVNALNQGFYGWPIHPKTGRDTPLSFSHHHFS